MKAYKKIINQTTVDNQKVSLQHSISETCVITYDVYDSYVLAYADSSLPPELIISCTDYDQGQIAFFKHVQNVALTAKNRWEARIAERQEEETLSL